METAGSDRGSQPTAEPLVERVGILVQHVSQIALRLSMLFQRGCLGVLELSGALLLVRAVSASHYVVDPTAVIAGSGLLIIGALFEFLIWLQVGKLHTLEPSLSTALREERDYLRGRLAALAPKGAFTSDKD